MLILANGSIGCKSNTVSVRESANESVAPLIARADKDRAAGDYETAIALYGQAFERTPWNVRLKRALAVTQTEKASAARQDGKLALAEGALRTALELYPDDTDFRRNLAVVLIERAQGSPNKAAAAALLEEARQLDPNFNVPAEVPNAGLERRLDLAFDLVKRSQLEAGISELETIRRDFPDDSQATRLLAQTLVRRADDFASRKNFEAAAESLDQSVELYAELLPCTGQRCDREELRVAHFNRVVVLVNAGREGAARSALSEAESLGFLFPGLHDVLDH